MKQQFKTLLQKECFVPTGGAITVDNNIQEKKSRKQSEYQALVNICANVLSFHLFPFI